MILFQNTYPFYILNVTFNNTEHLNENIINKTPLDVLFIMFSLLFLTSSYLFYKKRLTLLSNYKKIISTSNIDSRFLTKKATIVDFFLIIQTILILSTILCFKIIEYKSIVYSDFIAKFFTIVLSLSGFFFIKYCMYRLFSYFVFNINVSIIWTKTFVLLFQMLGIILFIPSIIMVYNESFNNICFIVAIIIFLFYNIFLFAKTYNIFVNNSIGILYFIVYLCGLEIMPYLVLFKLVV